MKKLKNKILFTILILLNVFLISILCIFNYQDYNNYKKTVETNLLRMNNEFNKPFNNLENNQQKIFMDTTIYTVVFNSKNEITDVISHTENSNNIDDIKEYVSGINYKEKRVYIGNLYFNKYSYSYNLDNTLTIIDNSQINSNLLSSLKTSIFIFVVLEIIIILISLELTKWIIRPVIESFEKQKNFVADASHELKTPLSIIMASSEALEKDTKNKKWLNNIKEETERMNKLVKSLLDLSKLENSNKEFSINDLSKITTKTILTFESLAFENNLSIDYNIEEDIKFNCNKDEISELISILIDNAIKHSYKNEKVCVNLNRSNDAIILEVINIGDEIKKEDQDKIFERFYRVDKSRNRDSNRYGLGLAIAKTIVTNHNGRMSVTSKNNLTTFKVVFKKNIKK